MRYRRNDGYFSCLNVKDIRNGGCLRQVSNLEPGVSVMARCKPSAVITIIIIVVLVLQMQTSSAADSEIVQQDSKPTDGTTTKVNHPGFRRYKPRKKARAEFVSLRCGIGSHWVASTKKCIPHEHGDSDESIESVEDSREMKFEAGQANKPEVKIVGHIVSLHCGIGYSYDKETHKCTPLPEFT